jgi:hypothetical protein
MIRSSLISCVEANFAKLCRQACNPLHSASLAALSALAQRAAIRAQVYKALHFL